MENIFTASKPFLKFFNYLGFFPMDYDGPAKDGKIKINAVGLIASVLNLFIVISLFITNLTKLSLTTEVCRLKF